MELRQETGVRDRHQRSADEQEPLLLVDLDNPTGPGSHARQDCARGSAVSRGARGGGAARVRRVSAVLRLLTNTARRRSKPEQSPPPYLKRQARKISVYRVSVLVIARIHADDHGNEPDCLLCRVVAKYRDAVAELEQLDGRAIP